jgi:hypothetical protein
MATSAAAAATRLTLRNPVRARIIALPLVRKRASPSTGDTSLNSNGNGGGGPVPTPATPGSSTTTLVEERERLLTYYQFQLSSSSEKEKAKAEEKAKEEKRLAEGGEKKGWLASKIPPEGIPAYAQTKAADLWASFGRAEGGWKVCIHSLCLQCPIDL